MDAGMIILLIVVFVGGWVLGHITARARAKQLDRPTPLGLGSGVDVGPVVHPPGDIGITIHDEQRQAIGSAIAQGRKIEAIKLYREATGAGLKEAKDAVEAWEARGALGGSDEWRQLPPENRL